MNYYDILKVSKNASQQEIRDSYIKLIKKYHPDIYKGSKNFAEKTTKEINDAYDILSVPEKRKEYDLSLEPPQLQNSSSGYNYTAYTSYYNKSKHKEQPEERPKETIEDIMKKNIHKIVDEKVSTMSKQAKARTIVIIILIALFFTILSINDYINLLTINKKRKEHRLEVQRQILDEEFRKSLEENENNAIYVEDVNSII